MRYVLRLDENADKTQLSRFQQFVVVKCFGVDCLSDFAFVCFCELSPKEIAQCAKVDFNVDTKLLSIKFALVDKIY